MENEQDHPDHLLPLTAEVLRREADRRITLIKQEFRDGFDFLMKHPVSVTVFGSARFSEDNPHYILARELGGRIASECGYSVITGGGPGIMEAANRGAFEAGGHSLGLGIDLPREQNINPYVTESMEFHYFFSRKVCLSFSAEAFIFFPGGFGTMDEFFEIITLVQTGKVQRLPLFLIGAEYWGQLDAFLKDQLVERGTIENADRELYTITDDLDEVITGIQSIPHISSGVRSKGVHRD